MNGLSEFQIAYREVLWADAELIAITIDYENLTLTLRESTGKIQRLVCEGYVGYEMVGVWDEVVIAGARLDATGPFLARCINELDGRLGTNRRASGSEARNRTVTMELTIILSDGCEVHVAMKGLRLDLPEKM